MEDADAAFRRALHMDPRNSHARVLYARYLQRSNDLDASRIRLAEGLELDTDDRYLRQAYAEVLAALSSPREAVEAQYHLAMGHQYQNWVAAHQFAVYLFWMSRDHEADDIFRTLEARGFDQRELRRVRHRPLFYRDVPRANGNVVRLQDTYGFIRRSNHPLDIYFTRYHLNEGVTATLAVGLDLEFEIDFTLKGPIATQVALK